MTLSDLSSQTYIVCNILIQLLGEGQYFYMLTVKSPTAALRGYFSTSSWNLTLSGQPVCQLCICHFSFVGYFGPYFPFLLIKNISLFTDTIFKNNQIWVIDLFLFTYQFLLIFKISSSFSSMNNLFLKIFIISLQEMYFFFQLISLFSFFPLIYSFTFLCFDSNQKSEEYF